MIFVPSHHRPVPPLAAASVALVAALVTLAVPARATAGHEPFAFADAKRGSLQVISGAFVARTSADLRGTWLNDTLGCDQSRSLRVRVLIDYTRGSTTKTVARRKTGAVRNCAEGGPNFGFTLRAPRIGLACASGRWKPGFYTFVVRTTHRASGLRATLSLAWPNRRRC